MEQLVEKFLKENSGYNMSKIIEDLVYSTLDYVIKKENFNKEYNFFECEGTSVHVFAEEISMSISYEGSYTFTLSYNKGTDSANEYIKYAQDLTTEALSL